MPKLKKNLWQLCQQALSTRATLLYRGLQVNPLCPGCNTSIEDVAHLFLQCSWVQEVWALASNHHWVSAFVYSSFSGNFLNWLSNLQTSSTLIPTDRMVALLWSIWKTRNNKAFRDKLPPYDHTN